MRTHAALATYICCMLASPLPAATMLFDFESERDVTLWHSEGKTYLGSDKKLAQDERFAASGRYSMRFFTPAWRPEEHGGRQKWPAFECKPPITDWSRYDRLVMELVNVTPATQRLMLFISDSKKPTRSGLSHRETLPPQGYVQAVIDLRKGFAAKKLNPRDIHVMHFYTEDPPIDMVVHIERLLLLERGEQIPAMPQKFLGELAELQAPRLESVRASLGNAVERLKRDAAAKPHLAAWVNARAAGLLAGLKEIETQLSQSDESVLTAPKAMVRLEERAANLESLLALRIEFEAVRPAVRVPKATGDAVVGFASSMEKVLPRSGSLPLETKARVEIKLAQNEKECVQVVVLPLDGPLKDVRVNVGDLRSDTGKAFPSRHIRAIPMGYVETKSVPPYGSRHVGWWPDPILDFMDKVDIAEGDAQSFWIRVHAPKDQSPGAYRGKLGVMAGDSMLFLFDLEVQVYGFAVPDASPLPSAITFAPHDHPTPDTKAQQLKWRQSEDYPVNAWKKHRSRWADFLADYYITIDSLYNYGGRLPAFEDLKRLHEQGRLGRFNLGYYGKCGESPEAVEKWTAQTIGRLRPRYEQAKALGLLAHAYIYGCDEHREKDFPLVQRAAEKIKAEFPDVMVMTTTYDHSFGLKSIIKSMDAWCPLTPRFDSSRAEKARAVGKEVWWYICCGPRHPYANMFVEFPAIEGRLLTGAMTAKYRPDGFLYYQISIWNSQKPIETGPFTDWDPRSWTTYHGDGSWTCVGPGGTPLPTIRLENFRDGLEDYAYFLVLEAMVSHVEASTQLRTSRAKWLAQAKELLRVPNALVASMRKYSRDPDLLRRWRDGLADAIESAGVKPVYPWPSAQSSH